MKGLYRLANIEFVRWMPFAGPLLIASFVIPIWMLRSAASDYNMFANHPRYEDLYAASGCGLLLLFLLALLCLYFLITIYSGYWGSKSVYTYLTLPIRRESLYWSKMLVFATYLLLFIGVQLLVISLGYAIFAAKAHVYLEGRYAMNNGLFLAFARSDEFRLLAPYSFSRVLSSVGLLTVLMTGIYYGALCERSRTYWGFAAIGVAALFAYRILVYRLNESAHLFEPRHLYPSSMLMLALTGFFIWHSIRIVKNGNIA
ncbi:hypothetical protein [Cohnella soli]|uniref:ABC transporter permease n=1 Tax=Cohnella soli TaxID=425005 RepID=A0ABW0HZM6_9BACL